jgi:hypothetical protein
LASSGRSSSGDKFDGAPQGLRFTISEPARREVLGRLLALNHERYEEEVKMGLHDAKRGKRKGGKRKAKKESGGKDSAVQGRLFD